MNRESNGKSEKARRREELSSDTAAEYARLQEERKGGRTGVRQFLREVRRELRLVHWPSRREVTQYTIVVLIAVSLITVYIFGLDFLFGRFVFWVFG